MGNGVNSCPKCGAPLPASAPEGLCPRCVMAMNMATQTDFTGEEGPHGTKTLKPAPLPEELAGKFPELEILELLGRGGMGAVYKARQKELDRIVALKILPPGIGETPGFAERFTREAKALAKLNHPNIVTLYEFGRTDGLFFFLMEYVDGVNLRQLLGSGRVAPREALAIVPQICDALQYAHDQGIVHRDIKPDNILMDRRGRVKVADFGLAKIVSEAGRAGSPLSAAGLQTEDGMNGVTRPTSELTEAGKLMGTPQYMAPEQADHPTEVDHRADIYALGVVFYQMLTGELPGKPIEPPSSRMRGAHIDVRLDEVVLRALENKPELRYQQASVFKTQIEAFTEASVQESVKGAKQRNRSPASFWIVSIGVSLLFFLSFDKLFQSIGWIVFLIPPAIFGVLNRIYFPTGWNAGEASPGTPPPVGENPSRPNEKLLNDARLRLKVPAIGLMIYGGLSLLLLVIPGVATLSKDGFVMIISMISGLLSTFVIFCARQMLGLRNYRLGVTGSILSLMPLSFVFPPTILLGIVFGVWSLIVLSKKEVREAFKTNRESSISAKKRGEPHFSRAAIIGTEVAGGSWSRGWWFRTARAVAIAVVAVFLIRTFILAPYVARSDAAAPEIPRGSRFMVWKLSHKFSPGDLIAYEKDRRVNVGRVVSGGGKTLLVNRSGEPDASIPRDAVLGKVVSVYLRAANTTTHPGLPPTPIGAEASPQTAMNEAVAFSPVMERVLPDPDNGGGKGNRETLILRTGEQISILDDAPKESGGRLRALAASKGDLFAEYDDFVGKRWAFVTAGLKLSDFLTRQWDSTGSEEVDEALKQPSALQRVEHSGATLYLLPDGLLPMTFAFESREGERGLMQITALKDNPRTVTIRFKVLQSNPAKDVSQAQAPFLEAMVERVLYSVAVQRPVKGLDLDSGKEIEVPDDISKRGEDVFFHWVAEHGMDLMAYGHKKRWNLWTSLKLASLDEPAWDKIAAKDIEAALRTKSNPLKLADPTEWQGIRSYDITGLQFPQAFAFRTSAGTAGVLQITGLSENPAGLRIRYKLAQLSGGTAHGEQTSGLAPIPPEAEKLLERTKALYESHHRSADRNTEVEFHKNLAALTAEMKWSLRGTIAEPLLREQEEESLKYQNALREKDEPAAKEALARTQELGRQIVSLISPDLATSANRSNKISESPPKTFKLSLLSGVSFEVIAICRNPRETNLWWKPDGAPFQAAPFEIVKLPKLGPTRSSRITVDPENEFLIYIQKEWPEHWPSDVSKSVSFGWSPPPSDVEFLPKVRDLRTEKTTQDAELIYFDQVPETLDFRAKVAPGPWEAIAIFDGKRTQELVQGVMVVCSNPTTPEKRNDQQFDVMHNVDREVYSMRLIARMKNGTTREVNFHPGPVTGNPSKGFAMLHPAEFGSADVKEYVIERARWERGEIRGIAMQPAMIVQAVGQGH